MAKPGGGECVDPSGRSYRKRVLIENFLAMKLTARMLYKYS